MSDPHAHSTGHAADELDADEPRTPMWMPLLGGFLFLGIAIFALAGGSENQAAAVAAPSAAPQATAAEPKIRVRRVPDSAIERVPGAAPGVRPAPRKVELDEHGHAPH